MSKGLDGREYRGRKIAIMSDLDWGFICGLLFAAGGLIAMGLFGWWMFA